jgi:hypothetical protein
VTFPTDHPNGVGTLVVHDDTNRRLLEEIELVLDKLIEQLVEALDRRS